MTGSEMLEMLKVDLGIRNTTAYDKRLLRLVQAAQEEIKREGVTLKNDVSDGQLTVMYAAWLWRRRDSMDGMPRALRYALNNRVFSEKMGGEH